MRNTALIATYDGLPDLYWDEQPLIDHLKSRGVDAAAAIWTDPTVSWHQASLILVRSCWDAWLHPNAFLEWLGRVEKVTTVVNDPDAIRWCFSKTYLKELEDKGVPIIPTQWLTEDSADNLREVATKHGWSNALVKPSISGDGYKTLHFTTDNQESVDAAQQIANELLDDRAVMVQPYLEAFDDNKEVSLTFIGGEFSHAYARPSLLVHGEESAHAQRTTIEPSPEVLQVAYQAIAAAPPAMWSRIDILDGEQPLLNELELVDPNLLMSFSKNGSCYERLADAIEHRLANQPS